MYIVDISDKRRLACARVDSAHVAGAGVYTQVCVQLLMLQQTSWWTHSMRMVPFTLVCVNAMPMCEARLAVCYAKLPQSHAIACDACDARNTTCVYGQKHDNSDHLVESC
jgi:hypothetical protein